MTSSVTRSQRHVRGHPCPICAGIDEADRDKGNRCGGYTSDDGLWCRCSSSQHSGSLDRDEYGLYRHMMRGACRCGDTHGQAVGRVTPIAVYDYRDERGVLLSQVTRWPDKRFSQRRPVGSGWENNLSGVRRVLYRLPELLAVPKDARVYFVEGEKDVETLRDRGLVATTILGGAGAWKQSREHAVSVLRGRNVVLIADADEPGRALGELVSKALEVPAFECSLGKDVTDHLRAGGTLDQIVPMQAPPPKTGTRERPPHIRSVPDAPSWGDDEPPGPVADERPEIRMGTDIHRVLDELDEKLGPTAPLLFQRSYQLVTVVGASGAKQIAYGTPVVREMTAPALLPHITRHVQLFSMSPPKAKASHLASVRGDDRPPEPERRNIIPTPTILNAFLCRGDWRHVRPLVGVSESPMMRSDGTIVQDAGYDTASGCLYQPSCEYPRVADHPTQYEAKAALIELLDVFCDFPYANDASRLVPISAILSILARPAISGPVPGHLFDASVIGSGKTLQCDVAHLIATGRVPAHAGWPAKDEDQEKLLSTYANSAPPGIVIDNVKGILGGSSLEQTLTSDSVEFRQLGGLDLRSIAWRSVLMFSGNNVALSDDMIRRVIMSRLESSLENPTERVDFKRPLLLDWVKGERARLAHLGLVVLRAYAAKGFPPTGIRLASYESWATVVGGALAYAGGGDVTQAQPPRERAALDDSGAAATLVERLPALMGDEARTLKAIVMGVYPAPGKGDPPDGYDDIRDALEALSPAKGPNGPNVLSVAKKLNKFNGRWFGNRRLRSVFDAHTKQLAWVVDVR